MQTDSIPWQQATENADCCSGSALWFGFLLLLSSYENNPLDKVRIHDQEVWRAEQNLHIEPYLLKYQLRPLKESCCSHGIKVINTVFSNRKSEQTLTLLCSPTYPTLMHKKRFLLVPKLFAILVHLNDFFNHKKSKPRIFSDHKPVHIIHSAEISLQITSIIIIIIII